MTKLKYIYYITAESMIIIIGGANELGAKTATFLSEKPNSNVVMVDSITDDNWHHLKNTPLSDLIHPQDLTTYLETHKKYVKTIINLHNRPPAIATDINDYLKENFRLALDLYHWCCRHRARLIHLSYEYEEATPAYLWSHNLLKGALTQVSTSDEREYPTPPQFCHLIVGRLFGKELPDSKSMLTSITSTSPTYQPLTVFDNCYRILVWLIKTPTISTTLNLSQRISVAQLQQLLTHAKDGIVFNPTSNPMMTLTELGFQEPFIPIEQGLSELLKN